MTTSAPWHSGECFPAKPEGQDYGYLKGRKLVGCTREQLVARCARFRFFDSQLVWLPETPRLIPAARVDFLYEPLRRRFKKWLIFEVVKGALITLALGLLAWAVRDDANYLGLILMVAFFMGARPCWQTIRVLRRFELLGLPIIDSDPFWVWLRSRRIPMTILVFVTVTFVAAFQVWFGGDKSCEAAGLEKTAVLHGDWWRIFTAAFLHAGLLHYLVNMASFFALGRLAETLASKAHLIVVFILAAALGNVCSLYFSLKPGVIGVGASGGILGLLGFLTVLGYRRKFMLPPEFVRLFITNIILVAVMGVVGFSIVDNAAHLGGLLTGVAVGFLTVRPGAEMPVQPSRPLKIAGLMATIGALVIAGFAAWKIRGS